MCYLRKVRLFCDLKFPHAAHTIMHRRGQGAFNPNPENDIGQEDTDWRQTGGPRRSRRKRNIIETNIYVDVDGKHSSLDFTL